MFRDGGTRAPRVREAYRRLLPWIENNDGRVSSEYGSMASRELRQNSLVWWCCALSMTPDGLHIVVEDVLLFQHAYADVLMYTHMVEL